jgi:hypothetical protein
VSAAYAERTLEAAWLQTAPEKRPGVAAWGSVASSLCTTALNPLYTRFSKIIGTSISEATMKPNLGPLRQDDVGPIQK